MDSLLPVLAICCCALFSVQGWPLNYQDPDVADYLPFPLDQQENGGYEDTADVTGRLYGAAPWQRAYGNENVEENQSADDDQYYPQQLPTATFADLPADLSNNGGNGPFKFAKPTSTAAPVVQTRSAPPPPPSLKVKAKPKGHIASINDETPLYLNYADREDPRGHKPTETTRAPATEATTINAESDNKDLDIQEDPFAIQAFRERLEEILAEQEEKEQQQQEQEQEENPEIVAESPEANSPEIDFTQQVILPNPEPQPQNEDEQEAESDTAENPEETEINEADENITQATPTTPPEELKVAKPSGQSQSLKVQPMIHLLPSHELQFLERNPMEKRAQSDGSSATTSGLIMPIVYACTGSVLFGLVVAAIFYRRQASKQSKFGDVEEPSYGVTGPPVKPNFLDLSGDRSLAKSAETYHYQHQKRQMLSGSFDQASSSAGSSEQKSGDHSDYDTEDDDDEGEDYGDYTVYECPGLAPPGEIEVVNPMFQPKKTPSPTQED